MREIYYIYQIKLKPSRLSYTLVINCLLVISLKKGDFLGLVFVLFKNKFFGVDVTVQSPCC